MNSQKTHQKKKLFSTDLILYFGFAFFFVLSLPFDVQLYRSLAAGPFFSFENWFQLGTFRTSYISEGLYVGNDLRGYYNWGIAAALGLVLAFFGKSYLEQKVKIDRDNLYYWLRVLLRYRLALAAVFVGIIKVLPLQIPEPTLSELHTEYGDLLPWKLYYITNGIATAGYLPVIGALEIIGGLLLLNRRTTIIGSGLLLALLLNVVIVNYVYEIGEEVYSSFLLLLASVIFYYDWPRFHAVLFTGTTIYPDGYWPTYAATVARVRPYLQASFLLILAIFSVLAYAAWEESNYPFPDRKAIPGIHGVYDVKDFVWNADTIPYAIDDAVRWKDVVFEKWNTVSIRDNAPVKIDSLKSKIAFRGQRDYEYLGNGGRHFYSYRYKAAKDKQTLTLKLRGKTDSLQQFAFSLERRGTDTLLLKGANQQGDSLAVKLVREDKKYLLREGRRKAIQIY